MNYIISALSPYLVQLLNKMLLNVSVFWLRKNSFNQIY